jgi:hypothetical protein
MNHSLSHLAHFITTSRPRFTISENGVSGPGENVTRPPEVLNDEYRQRYYLTYIDELCKAITQDGVNFSTYWWAGPARRARGGAARVLMGCMGCSAAASNASSRPHPPPRRPSSPSPTQPQGLVPLGQL